MGWIATGLARRIPYWLKNFNSVWYTPENLRPISYARNWIADVFMQTEYSHFWLIDADTTPPRSALQRMLDADVPVIGAGVNVMKLDSDGITKPVRMFMRQNGSGYYEAHGSGVEQVDRIGFGCVLFEREVFGMMDFPWFEERNWGEVRGTDFLMCERLEENAIPIFAHFDIQCGHRKEIVY